MQTTKSQVIYRVRESPEVGEFIISKTSERGKSERGNSILNKGPHNFKYYY